MSDMLEPLHVTLATFFLVAIVVGVGCAVVGHLLVKVGQELQRRQRLGLPPYQPDGTYKPRSRRP